MQQECLNRLSGPTMAYYREVYAGSERWNGSDSLEERRVIVFGEAGDGDIIQFARYIPLLKEHGCEIVFHCPKRLHRLFRQLKVKLLDIKETDLPIHEFHIPSMSLPFVLNQADVKLPYLQADQMDLEFEGTKVGIAWEGNPEHSNCGERNCPLRHFRFLNKPDRRLFMIQKKVHSWNMLEGAEDLDLYSAPINDYYDTAVLLNSLDYIVSVDTSVIHLAGALGKKVYLLLSYRCDPRWEVREWYDNMTILRQSDPDNWSGVMETLGGLLED